jgi:hypothetical protein
MALSASNPGQLRMRSSATASVVFRIEAGTRIDPADLLHKRLQPRPRHLAVSGISKRSCPFADCLAIGVLRGTANDGSEWICLPVEWEIGKFERVPQKLLGFSPHFVVHDRLKHDAQVFIYGVASASCLELVPSITDLFKALPKGDFWCFTFRCTMCLPKRSRNRHGSGHHLLVRPNTIRFAGLLAYSGSNKLVRGTRHRPLLRLSFSLSDSL